MIQEIITCEIKNVIIALGKSHKGFHVYIRPINESIEEFYEKCVLRSLKKLEEVQNTTKGKYRYWKQPILPMFKYKAANKRFFQLCKQANLKQIQFQ